MIPFVRSIALVITLSGAVDIQAATFKLVLLGKNNQPLGHGQATIIVKSPEHGWTRYVGFYKQQQFYTAKLPDVDYLNIFIYTTADTRQKMLQGIYGKRDQTFYLRTDHVGYVECSAAHTEWGMPYDLFELVQDLDAAFPTGVPRRMTNIRSQLEKTVLPVLNNTADPNDPNIAQQKEEFRQRVMRHLR